jgi:hypothetical protein
MSIESFIKKVCVQTAVYWGNPKSNGTGGNTYDTPIEIKCRWDYKTRMVLGANGLQINTDVDVLVTVDLVLGGFLFLGTLEDLDDSSIPLDSGQTYPTPDQVEKAYGILTVSKVSMIKSLTQFVRTVSLSTYKV